MGMIKTDIATCKHCKYSSSSSNSERPTCNYLLETGSRRGCEIGECDKFVEATKRDHKEKLRIIINNQTTTVIKNKD